jgi:hypothetical protein
VTATGFSVATPLFETLGVQLSEVLPQEPPGLVFVGYVLVVVPAVCP